MPTALALSAFAKAAFYAAITGLWQGLIYALPWANSEVRTKPPKGLDPTWATQHIVAAVKPRNRIRWWAAGLVLASGLSHGRTVSGETRAPAEKNQTKPRAEVRGAGFWSQWERLHGDWVQYGSLAILHARSEPISKFKHYLSRSLWLGRNALSLTPSPPPSSLDTPVLVQPPVPGPLSSPFGLRRDPVRRRHVKHHKGIDLVATRGTKVKSAGPGYVVQARTKGAYGKLVIISHGLGLETRYAHLSQILVDEGEFIPVGAVIGRVGSTGRVTGPHLHFEVRQDGVPVEPSTVVDFDVPDCAPAARRCRRPNPDS